MTRVSLSERDICTKRITPAVLQGQRIITRVDELMAICDQLEAQLSQAQTDSRRFLEAVLHEALASAESEHEREVSYA